MFDLISNQHRARQVVVPGSKCSSAFWGELRQASELSASAFWGESRQASELSSSAFWGESRQASELRHPLRIEKRLN